MSAILKRMQWMIGLLILVKFQTGFTQEVNIDTVYDPYIYSIRFTRLNYIRWTPIYHLNDPNVDLSFDDIGNNNRRFTYKVVHCDIDWQPSGIPESDYAAPFAEGRISDYRDPYFTKIPYQTYHLQLIQSTKLLISGNYLIHVYDDTAGGVPVFTKRFVIVETVGLAEIQYNSSHSVEHGSSEGMEVQFKIEDLQIVDPMNSIAMNLVQNGRWDNAKLHVRPSLQGIRSFTFYGQSLEFPSGNEYRYLDIHSLGTKFFQIDRMAEEKDGWKIRLKKERVRTQYAGIPIFKMYGNFVEAIDSTTVRGDADYAWVTFGLKHPELEKAKMYIEGGFTQWTLDPKYEMVYDPEEGVYTIELLMKQGIYNYQYIQVPNGSQSKDATITEGNHHATRNFYVAYIYLKQPTDRYWRVIGFNVLAN